MQQVQTAPRNWDPNVLVAGLIYVLKQEVMTGCDTCTGPEIFLRTNVQQQDVTEESQRKRTNQRVMSVTSCQTQDDML